MAFHTARNNVKYYLEDYEKVLSGENEAYLNLVKLSYNDIFGNHRN